MTEPQDEATTLIDYWADDDGLHDELEDYLAQLLQSPAFARAYYRAGTAEPARLCINGHEYRRRQKARQRKH